MDDEARKKAAEIYRRIHAEVADDLDRSIIHEQVEMGVAVRMACLDAMIGGRRNSLGAAA